MTLAILKWIRFFIPGALFVTYGIVFLYIMTGKALQLPDYSKMQYLPIIIIPAAFYYVTPLRSWFNKASHRQITEKLRIGMVQISGLDDDPEKFTWKNLRSLFFKFVDGNASLKTKASLAYFNGALWTTFADSQAVAAWYAILSVVMFFFDVQGWLGALITFIAILVVSAVGNSVCTRKHIAIGEEQLEIMKFEYRDEIIMRLKQLD